MNSNSLVIEALDERWQFFSSNLEKAIQAFSEEAVHDLRVSTRRLLAVLDLVRLLDPACRGKKIRGGLKELLDGFDGLRDTQVMLLISNAELSGLPGWVSFRAALLGKEQKYLQSAEKKLRGMKIEDISRRFSKIRAKALLMDHPDSALLAVVDETYQVALLRLGRVDSNHVETIHSLRIAFKKFRYMLECVHPLVPGFTSKHFKLLRDYQTLMGRIQDSEVLQQALGKFTSKSNKTGMEPVRQFFQSQYSNELKVFLENKTRLHDFWRMDQEAEFPWIMKCIEKI
jgi:CHAD domain-containing protein